MKSSGFASALIAVSLGTMPFAASAAPDYMRYSIVSGKYAAGVALNDRARYAVNNFPPDIPYETAFISGGVPNVILNSLGGNITRIRSLNNYDEAVGDSTTASGALHAFLYAGGQMRDLTAAYGLHSVRSINDIHYITGQSADSRAMVIRNGIPDVFGPPNSTAGAVSETGDVLVEYTPAGQGIHTAVYSDARRTLSDLPLLGGAHLIGTAISNDGLVTGYGFTCDNLSHAFLFDGGTMTDLTPDARSSAGYDINNLNHVVGTVDNRAFWYTGGKVIDLNTLIDPNADLLLTAAIAINDRDQILAKGCDRAGVFCNETVLLNSVYAIPEPREYLMLAAGLLTLGLRRRFLRKNLPHPEHRCAEAPCGRPASGG